MELKKTKNGILMNKKLAPHTIQKVSLTKAKHKIMHEFYKKSKDLDFKIQCNLKA